MERLDIGREIDREAFERARQARDPRFDGRFFIGVRTTGVYCRPVCPVRIPLARNVTFYASAAAAAEAGFRPCLRCRPEASPGTPAWNGTSTTVSRGLRLIESGALDRSDVTALAERLGVGARHLRRLFRHHLGASPVAVAQTRRLHFAKTLIDETDLPISAVALEAGFGSVRRFNAAFAKTYRRSPSSLRGPRREAAMSSGLRLHLSFRPPYDWPLMLGFLSRRAVRGVEQVDGGSYRRGILVDGKPGWFSVQANGPNALALDIHLSGSGALAEVVSRVRRQFDLAADPLSIDARLGRDPLLAPLVQARPGLRLPGGWDAFEIGVRAILGQQVSVAAAHTLAGRIAERFGEPIGEFPNGDTMRLFPSADALAGADLGGIGLTRRRAATLGAFARAVAGGRIDLRALVDIGSLKAALLSLPGIGPWTAEYVAMRGLSEPDAFPAADLGLLRATGLTRRALEERAEAWRPWRAYAAIHLWHAAT